jgi:hypothetical protein
MQREVRTMERAAVRLPDLRARAEIRCMGSAVSRTGKRCRRPGTAGKARMDIQGLAGAVQVELLGQGTRCRAGHPFLGHGSVGMVVGHTLKQPVPEHEGGHDGQRHDPHPVSHPDMIKGPPAEVNCESFLSGRPCQASAAGSRSDILRSGPRRDRDDGGHVEKDEIRRLYEWIQGRVRMH